MEKRPRVQVTRRLASYSGADPRNDFSVRGAAAAARKVIRSAIGRLHDFAPLALHPIPNKLSIRIHVDRPRCTLATGELVAGEVQQAGPPNETEADFRDERDRALSKNVPRI